jgi:hypothetical protein
MEKGVVLCRGSSALAPSEEKSTVVLVPPFGTKFTPTFTFLKLPRVFFLRTSGPKSYADTANSYTHQTTKEKTHQIKKKQIYSIYMEYPLLSAALTIQSSSSRTRGGEATWLDASSSRLPLPHPSLRRVQESIDAYSLTPTRSPPPFVTDPSGILIDSVRKPLVFLDLICRLFSEQSNPQRYRLDEYSNHPVYCGFGCCV